jgi:hypothetical protein
MLWIFQPLSCMKKVSSKAGSWSPQLDSIRSPTLPNSEGITINLWSRTLSSRRMTQTWLKRETHQIFRSKRASRTKQHLLRVLTTNGKARSRSCLNMSSLMTTSSSNLIMIFPLKTIWLRLKEQK